jgi:hypothetical protein
MSCDGFVDKRGRRLGEAFALARVVLHILDCFQLNPLL